MSSNPLRKGRQYDSERFKFMGVCELHNVACWLCNGARGPIDYKAKSNTPKAFELDHARPLSTHPELAYEPSNFRASHSQCNRSRGDKAMPVSVRGTAWVQADW